MSNGMPFTPPPDLFARRRVVPGLFNQIRWDQVDHERIRILINLAREEDVGGIGLRNKPIQCGDPTTALLPPGLNGSARIVARQELVICGLPLIPLILDEYGNGFSWQSSFQDGARVPAGTTLGTLKGPVLTLLTAERVLLNFLQKLSGVATLTATYVDALDCSATRLLDTRKTTPGYRILEKYAVACGGGWNHRLGLFDRIMLKDNHLAAAGSLGNGALADTIRRARKLHPDLGVEVEVDRIDQIAEVLNAGADIILLDNFTNSDIETALQLIDGSAWTEASGNITLTRLPGMAKLGLDFISTGATVHQASWVDIGLDWSQ